MAINWAPTVAEEVAQNVRTIVATETGSVPLARELGTPQDVVDQPQSAAGARLQASVVKAVRTYEPRALVTDVELEATVDGKLSVTVKWEGAT